jgi:hypothetical protein
MKTCAYCGGSGTMRKEHLMPACLLKRTADYELQFHKPAPKRFVDGEITIRDVCRTCNNELLSPLDVYLCKLYDAYFVRIVREKESIHFTYDYDLLTRWLLKTSYNYARANKAPDTPQLAAFRDYMLHGQPAPQYVGVLAQLIIPSYEAVPENNEVAGASSVSTLVELPPTMWRVSQGNPYGYGVPLVIFRRILLNSYCFYLVAARENGTITPIEWVEVLREVAEDIGGAHLLRSDSGSEFLRASKVTSLDLSGDHVLQNYAGYQKEVARLSKKHKKK